VIKTFSQDKVYIPDNHYRCRIFLLMCPLFLAVALELDVSLLFVLEVGVPKRSLLLLPPPAMLPVSFRCEGESAKEH